MGRPGVELVVLAGGRLGRRGAQGLGAHDDPLAVGGQRQHVAGVTSDDATGLVVGVEIDRRALRQPFNLAFAHGDPRGSLDGLLRALEGVGAGTGATLETAHMVPPAHPM